MSDDVKQEQKRSESAPRPEEEALRIEIRENAAKAGAARERTRVQHILEMGKAAGLATETIQLYVDKGTAADEFRRLIPQLRGEAQREIEGIDTSGGVDIGLSKKEVRQFSFCRAILALANPNDPNAQRAAAFELEVSRATAAARGSSGSGISVPGRDPLFVMGDSRLSAALNRARRQGDLQSVAIPGEIVRNYVAERAALSVGTATAAGNLVATDLLAQNFIDILRNRTLTINPNALNCTFLSDLQGNVAIPRKTASSGFGWIATEGGNSAEATITVDQVTMNPKTAGCYKDFTRRLLLQSSLDVENFVRTDLADQIGVGLDLAVLYGSGAAGQPTGIANTGSIGSVTFAAPGAPTFAEIVEFESDVEAGNALLGSLAYVTTPALRGTLKTTKVDAGSGRFLWTGGMTGDVNGYPAYSTAQVTAGDVLFGNFADCLVGMWGGLDLTVDPYTSSISGTIRVVGLVSMDVAVRHPASFSLGN